MPDQSTTHPLDRRACGACAAAARGGGRAVSSRAWAGETRCDWWLGEARTAASACTGACTPLGYLNLTRNGHFMAAVLACGERAALSHFSAAVLWGMLNDRGGTIHVTADGRRRRPGLVVHEAALGDEEVGRRAGIAVTTPARTLIDLADVAPRRTLERAIDEAEYLRLDCTGLAPRHGRSGSGRLASVLAVHTAGSTRTRSELEEIFLALCDNTNPAPRGERPHRGLRVRLRLARAAPDRRNRRRGGSRHKGGDEARSGAGRGSDDRRVACLAADLRAAVS